MALVFELSVGVDHDPMSFNGHALNPINLIVCLVQVINAIEESFAIALPQSNISTF